MIYFKDYYITRTCELHAVVAVGLPTISLSMILMTLFLAFIVGLWNKPTKLKSMRTGRCACNPWCFENHMECPLNSEVWNSILILSCLSALLPVAEGHKTQALQDIQDALQDNETKLLFQRSNANPTNENQHKPMIEKSLEVYNKNKCSERHPCELQELAPSKKFLEKMTEFLEKQQTLCRQTSTITCD
ncbi:uncharacterized protein LOC107730128 isoform X2 [Sinocyclocheilus rhinocerous]|uniref:uncharacterized protein LOC107730128 isoform X2 n=1 Tax=Sinocyclocheilus rhinocerous TaxID=307959 RepID=UPI0007BA77AD|nr:PREDICTED: uncharacterized protein LOC107730128 isoform X2 [Sinocyclocheilus rhinocerous]